MQEIELHLMIASTLSLTEISEILYGVDRGSDWQCRLTRHLIAAQ